ncbi:MAG: hypothetical protein KFH98_05195, partial [Gemmatimonadetes bacterium]|nr:hypothetical protein [Gemmatimonadota bacterium]
MNLRRNNSPPIPLRVRAMPLRVRAVLFACGLLMPAGSLAAQSAASPFVPVGHWSINAVDRLHALGLAPAGTARGQRSRTVSEVRAVLEAGAESGDAGAQGYLERFKDEFRSAGAPAGVLTHISGAAGFGLTEGDVAHGVYTTWGEEN